MISFLAFTGLVENPKH